MSLEMKRDYNAQENRGDMVLTGEVDISNERYGFISFYCP